MAHPPRVDAEEPVGIQAGVGVVELAKGLAANDFLSHQLEHLTLKDVLWVNSAVAVEDSRPVQDALEPNRTNEGARTKLSAFVASFSSA